MNKTTADLQVYNVHMMIDANNPKTGDSKEKRQKITNQFPKRKKAKNAQKTRAKKKNSKPSLFTQMHRQGKTTTNKRREVPST